MQGEKFDPRQAWEDFKAWPKWAKWTLAGVLVVIAIGMVFVG